MKRKTGTGPGARAGSRDVVYMGTRNVYHQMPAAVWSLLKHTPSVDRVFILAEDDELPRMLPDERIRIINVSGQTDFPPDGPNFVNWWAWIVLLRACLSRYLPDDVTKVLSLDNDTVVLDDIGELWDLDMSGCCQAMALDIDEKQWPGMPYYNAGVCMHDLEAEKPYTAKVVRALNTDKMYYPEQDAFNRFYRGKVLELPREYNVMPKFFDKVEEPKIIHYAGIKHHEDYLLVQQYADEALDIIARGVMV